MATGVIQKPPWLRIRPPDSDSFKVLREKLPRLGLHTVCEEAHCPNMSECWSAGTATFMVLGDTCTRGCRFCAIKTAAKPLPPNPLEPETLAKTIEEMKLGYVVITSVDRDDLPDQGAGHFAACIRAVRKENPKTKIEVLTPDFRGEKACIRTVLDACPDVFGHNLETVKRLQSTVRDRRANYEQSLEVLAFVKKSSPETFTKSALMLGLGETEDEVLEAFDGLRKAMVDIVYVGQYLQPSARHIALKEYVAPAVFARLEAAAKEKGFLYAKAGPFVRSSYKAESFFEKKGQEHARSAK